MLVRLEDLGRDQEDLVSPSPTEQAAPRVHPGDPEELPHLLGRVLIEPSEELACLLDPASATQPPLGLDLRRSGSRPNSRIMAWSRTWLVHKSRWYRPLGEAPTMLAATRAVTATIIRLNQPAGADRSAQGTARSFVAFEAPDSRTGTSVSCS